jgi:hypothetical protein
VQSPGRKGGARGKGRAHHGGGDSVMMVARKAVRNGGSSTTSTGEKPRGGEGACTTGAKIGESGGLVKAVVFNLTHGDGGRPMGWCQERGGGGGSHPIGGWRPAGSGPRPTGACRVAWRDHATRSAEQGRGRGRPVGHSLIRRPTVPGLNKSQINSNAPKLALVQTGPSLTAKI